MGPNPRQAGSKELDWPSEPFQPRRLKIRNWRIVYPVDNAAQWVWVLALVNVHLTITAIWVNCWGAWLEGRNARLTIPGRTGYHVAEVSGRCLIKW